MTRDLSQTLEDLRRELRGLKSADRARAHVWTSTKTGVYTLLEQPSTMPRTLVCTITSSAPDWPTLYCSYTDPVTGEDMQPLTPYKEIRRGGLSAVNAYRWDHLKGAKSHRISWRVVGQSVESVTFKVV